MKFEVIFEGRPRVLDISLDGEAYRLQADGKTIEFHCARLPGGILSILMGDRSYSARVQETPAGHCVQIQDLSYEFEVLEGGVGGDARGAAGAHGTHRILAPMPGKIVAILKRPGDAVGEGVGVLVVEAMKMQNELRSHRAGIVKEILVSPGDAVETSAVVAVIDSGTAPVPKEGA